jgi:2-hydroxycyclohexanecarboxyl-CoA dehydrogenase
VSRVAVVTGGASGIGLGVARGFLDDGYQVAILDYDGDAIESASAELVGRGASFSALEVDVADRGSVDDAYAQIRADLGPIDIVVTSAGVESFDNVWEISMELWNRIIAINLTGTFNCIQAGLADMMAAGWGRIVTISSSSAQSGAPNMAHYAASKGGVVSLTRSLAREYAPRGITVNNIPPSGIETPMQHQQQAAGILPPTEQMVANIPIGHMGTGDDIAAMVGFLSSDEAGFITGQTIGVNGGSVM